MAEQYIISAGAYEGIIGTGSFHYCRGSGRTGSNIDGQLSCILVSITLCQLIVEHIRLTHIVEIRVRCIGVGTITVDFE